MHYRPLGKTGIDVSMLSLGCMGFVDDLSAFETVQAALDCGVNYFETCRGYTDSERRLGQGLGDRRGDVMVSTKSYGERVDGKSVADTMRLRLDEQLRRLNTDYVDFYHAWHATTEADYEAVTKPGGWLTGALRAKEEGLIRHIGITTHGVPELVLRMIDDGHWETITVQVSLLVTAYRDVIAHAHDKGVGVIAIGGMAGGLLTSPAPMLRQIFGDDDQAAAALRYVLADPGVSSVAAGMVWPEEVRANAAAIDAMADELSIDDRRRIDDRLAEILDAEDMTEVKRLWCDGCGRCIAVCNQLTEPWALMRGYNGAMLGARPREPEGYVRLAQEVLGRCPTCGRCANVCPRGIDIPEHVRRIRDVMATFGKRKDKA